MFTLLNIRTLLLVMLLVCIILVTTVNAQENSLTSDKPSGLEQGLIDSLKSNTNNLPTDDLIANYCEANQYKTSILGDNNVSDKNDSRTYKLKNGSNITFINRNYFLIDDLKVNNNTIQQVNKNKTNSKSGEISFYTPLLTSSISEYNWFGWKLFTVCTTGYFEYNYNSVQPYFYDSWYVHNMPFNLWQISNWKKGTHIISNNTAEVYGQGNFHYGFEYNGNGLTVQNYYVKAYLSCDQNGNYATHYSVINLNPKFKIGSLNLEL
jgi:hypothetical protein